MAVIFKQLATVNITSTSPTVVYTVPAATTTHIKRLHIANRDTKGVVSTMDIWFTPSGTADDTNLTYPETEIVGKQAFKDPDWFYLPATGTIEVEANKANVFTVTVYGVEFS